MPAPLNELERDVLDYLIEHLRDHTYQPSIRQIGATFDIKSTKSVSELLQSLADKGWIERDPSRSRGVRILGLDLRSEGVSVPHVDVHLSDPVLREPIDHLILDRRLVGSPACFMISMVGNSMRESGIRDGDLLVIEPVDPDDLEDGDLVAARLEGETAIRRFVVQGDDALLDAGRLDLPPVSLAYTSGAHVLGRVVAVLRRLRTDSPAGRVEKEHVHEGAVAT
jgi:repressor LexA